MYTVVDYIPKTIFLVYIAMIGASLVAYPMIRLLATAAEKGLGKWR